MAVAMHASEKLSFWLVACELAMSVPCRGTAGGHWNISSDVAVSGPRPILFQRQSPPLRIGASTDVGFSSPSPRTEVAAAAGSQAWFGSEEACCGWPAP